MRPRNPYTVIWQRYYKKAPQNSKTTDSSFMNIDIQFLTKYLQTKFSIKNDPVEFIPEMQAWFNIQK